jgi:hypothetical protein
MDEQRSRITLAGAGFQSPHEEESKRKMAATNYGGHDSHVTMDFLHYCDDNKILVVVYPPSTLSQSATTLPIITTAAFRAEW